MPSVFQIQDAGPLNDLSVRQFYFLRFMLGFFEGGFFPSVILYLTLWFPARDRAKAIATFMAAIPVSSLIVFAYFGASSPVSSTGLVLPAGRQISSSRASRQS